MNRLTIDISDRQHSSLKVDADEAWSELVGLLIKRIDQGLAGKVTNRRIDEILSEELDGNRSASRPEMTSSIRSANRQP